MELAGAFRLGGDVDLAYAFGVERIGQAIDARASRAWSGPRVQEPRTAAAVSESVPISER